MEYDIIPKQVSKANPAKVALSVKSGEQILYMDQVDLSKEDKRAQFVEALVKECPGFEREKDNVSGRLLQIADELLTTDESEDNEQQTETPLAKSKSILEDTDIELVKHAQKLLQSPHLIEKTVSHVHGLGVAGEDELVVAIYIIATSRLLKKPLAGLTMGQSSAGKSYVINMVSKLFPDEAVLRAHQISPKALLYLEPGSLIHRFVAAGERSRLKDDAAGEATRMLREMISDQRLSSLVSASQQVGPHQTLHIEQDGPIAYVESTTLGVEEIFNEDRTRFLLLCSDERRDQTKAIIDKIARSVSGPTDTNTPDSIIALHNTVQRLLQPNDVVIPFAGELRDCLPTERIEVRRTFGHLMALIQAVALLYQYQRSKNEYGQVIAALQDYEIVRKYLARPLATSLGCVLTPGAESLLHVLETMDEFTVSEAAAKVAPSINTVRARIGELLAAGRIIQTEEAKGRAPAKYRVDVDAPALHGLILPELSPGKNEKLCINAPETVGDKI